MAPLDARWAAELAAEGMHELSLPSPASTNGTQLVTQMRHNIIQGMITWHDTWGPRYGVLPGYGIAMQNGFQDTFTATAMGVLMSIFKLPAPSFAPPPYSLLELVLR